MSRIYTVPFSATVTAAGGNTDLWELKPADDKPIKLCAMRLSQYSEVGDAAEEGLSISIIRMTATVTDAAGTGSTAVTPVPMDSAGAASGFAAIVNSPTVATTSGTTTTLEELGWNERNTPCDFWYPDDEYMPKVKQGEALLIRMNTTLADDMSFSGVLWVKEE